MSKKCDPPIYIPSQDINRYIIQAEIQAKEGIVGKYPFRIETQTSQSLITLNTCQSIEPSIIHKSKYLDDVKVECIKMANLYLLNCEFKVIDDGYNVIGKDVLNYFAYQIIPKDGLYLYPDPNSENLLANGNKFFWINSKTFPRELFIPMTIPF